MKELLCLRPQDFKTFSWIENYKAGSGIQDSAQDFLRGGWAEPLNYCRTRIFSVDKFSSKYCYGEFATSIFRECVTVKNINKSNNIKMLLASG